MSFVEQFFYGETESTLNGDGACPGGRCSLYGDSEQTFQNLFKVNAALLLYRSHRR
jgi:hypothetical protein